MKELLLDGVQTVVVCTFSTALAVFMEEVALVVLDAII
jgi:hypothetical protein